MIGNCDVCIKALEGMKDIKIISIRGKDISDGNKKLTAAIVW